MVFAVKAGWFSTLIATGMSLFLVFSGGAVHGQTPVLPPPPSEFTNDLPGTVGVYVREFEFTGNTVFSRDRLAEVIRSYAQRRVTSAELEQARRDLTLHYIQHGYVNSGAILEDQSVSNGIITFTVVEGRLSEIALEGNRRLRAKMIRQRLQLHAGPPLNLNTLQEGLLILKNNPNVQRLNAELMPSGQPGRALLDVKIREANPWHLGVEARNDRPPSVGAELLELAASHSNLSGHSDELAFRYGIAHRTHDGAEFSELDDWGISYTIPVTSRETTVRVYYDRNDFTVIEEPFADLGINSESAAYGIAVRHPLLRSIRREFALGLIAERRESETFLLGQPFSFRAGDANAQSHETVLRFFQEWVLREQAQVLALRSTVSWGVDVLSPTRGREPNGLFVAWLGQAQYVRRLGATQNQIIWNTSVQWASEPLLSLEQFSLGGANTVRGYRENQIIRDMGLLSSVELRLPLVESATGAPVFEIAPFFDFGMGWNSRGSTRQPSDLSSAGLGVIYHPHRKISARVYWGYGLRKFDQNSNDLQDYGIHFKLTFSLF